MAMIGIRYLTLLAVLLVALFGLAQVVLGSNIDPTDKWAWSTNAGWINFDPHCTGCEGVTVYSDHLSGYAWGTNVGWINFHPTGSQVTIDSTTGRFDGYAWGENVGWIHFKGDTYGVTTGNHVYLPTVLRGA